MLSVCSLILILVNYVNISRPIAIGNLIGMILGVVGGISTFVYSKQSYLLTKKTALHSTEILATRFWLLWVLAIGVMLSSHSYVKINLHDGAMLLVISLLTMILPLFFSQESIRKIGPERTAVVTGLIPVISYVMTAVYTHAYEFKMFFLCLTVTIMIGLTEILSKKPTELLSALKSMDK